MSVKKLSQQSEIEFYRDKVQVELTEDISVNIENNDLGIVTEK